MKGPRLENIDELGTYLDDGVCSEGDCGNGP